MRGGGVLFDLGHDVFHALLVGEVRVLLFLVGHVGPDGDAVELTGGLLAGLLDFGGFLGLALGLFD